MKTLIKTTFFATVMLFGAVAVAQTEPEKNVGNVEIDVVDQYKASIKKAVKISDQPNFTDTTTRKMAVQYKLTPQFFPVKFTPQIIKPVTVSGVRLAKLPKSTVKLGAGMYTSSLVEVLLSSTRAEKFNWEVGLNHRGAVGGVKDIAYNKSPYFENNLNLAGRWLMRNYRLQGQAGIDWNRYNYYGIPQAAIDTGYVAPERAQNDFQRYYGSATFTKMNKKQRALFDEAKLHYHYFTNNWNTNESRFEVHSQWQLPQEIKNHEVGADLNVFYQNTNASAIATNISQLNVQFYPKAQGTYSWFAYTLGLNFNFFNVKNRIAEVNQDPDFLIYFYPHITLNAELVRDILAMYGGWQGDVTMNGQYNLSLQNPFLLPATALSPTSSQKIFGGLAGKVVKNVQYKAETGLRYVTSLPLFYRDGNMLTTPFAGADLPAFGVNYARGTIFNLRGDLSYNSKKTGVSAYGEWFGYSLKVSDVKSAFHLPTFTAGIDVRLNLQDKIEIKAGVAYIAGRKALNADGTLFEADLKDIWDAHLTTTYHINKNLAAGLEFANLASQQYQLWLGYPVQRFRALLYLQYSF